MARAGWWAFGAAWLIGCGARTSFHDEFDGGRAGSLDVAPAEAAPVDAGLAEVQVPADREPVDEETVRARCAALGDIPAPRRSARSLAEFVGEWRFCRSTGSRSMIFDDPAHAGFTVSLDGRWRLLRTDDGGRVVAGDAPGDEGTIEARPDSSGQYLAVTFLRAGGGRLELYMVLSPDGSGIVTGRLQQGSHGTVYARVARSP